MFLFFFSPTVIAGEGEWGKGKFLTSMLRIVGGRLLMFFYMNLP